MKTASRLRLYTGLLISLVGLFVIGTIMGPRRGGPLGPIFPEFDAAVVRGITISSGDGVIMLRRDGADWSIVEDQWTLPARADRIDSLLEEVGQSTLVRKVTGNPDLWARFNVTDGAGVVLALEFETAGSDTPDTIVWGGGASEPGLSYIRFSDTPEVYATDARLTFYLQQPRTYWSYLRVLPESVVATDIISVRGDADISVGAGEELSGSYALHRTVGAEPGAPESWIADGVQGTLDPDAVNRLMRDIADLVGADFAPGESVDAPGAGAITITLSDAREFTIDIDERTGAFVCRASGPELPGDAYGGLTYTLRPATVRQLFPRVEDLLGQ